MRSTLCDFIIHNVCIEESFGFIRSALGKLPLCAILYYSQQVIEKYTLLQTEVVVVVRDLQIARCRRESSYTIMKSINLRY
jgi:hypothetical protein